MTDSLEQLLEDTKGELRDFVNNRTPSDEEVMRVRILQGIYSSATRELQTRGAREAARYAMAADLSLSAEDKAEYIRLSMPDHAVNTIVRQRRKELKSAQG